MRVAVGIAMSGVVAAWAATAGAQDAPGSGREAAPPLPSPPTTEARPDAVWRLIAPAEVDGRDANEGPVHGWLRFDTDAHALGLYVGGSYRIGGGWAFAPFAHAQGTLVEPSLAFSYQIGGLWVMPALGTTLDFGSTNLVSVDPQLFVSADLGPVYLEGWVQYFAAAALHSNAIDQAQFRGMALVVLSRYVAAGVEGDMTLATKNAPNGEWLSAPLGGRVNLRLGDHDTVGLFLGYETVSSNRGDGDGVAGRLEFAHRW